MKKAPNLRLSLRKLIIATMAVGPLAVLPSSLWAVVPTYVAGGLTNSFTVPNGTASVATSANVANISTTDRAVLVWGTDGTPALTGAASNFNIAVGETYNFILPSGGAVLNRVTKGAGAGNAATIAGTLFSNGKVFVLSDSGNIAVSTGAVISTAGGLVLSTLAEGSSGAFTSFGDLSYTGVSNGDITIGATASVGGNITAVGGTVSFAAPSVAGDVVLRSVTSAAGIALGASVITGNLSVTTNNGAITQSGAVLVGTANGTQTTNLTSGTANIDLSNAANDFKVVSVQTTNVALNTADVTLGDANNITLAASTVGRNLVVNAGGVSGEPSIVTNGALGVGGNATFTATTGNSAITIANGTTIGGNLNVTGTGNLTANVTGNLAIGTISQAAGNRAVAITSDANLTVVGAVTASNNSTAPGITLTGTNVTFAGGSVNNTGPVTMNATAGNVTLGTITANQITARATGDVLQAAGTVVTTNNATGTSLFVAGNYINVNQANAFANGQTIQLTGANADIYSTNNITLGTTNVTGNVALNTIVAGKNIQLGTGTGTGVGQNIVIGGVLTANASGAATITDNDYSSLNVAGGLNLTTGTGAITLNAGNAFGSLSENTQFGRVSASTTGEITLVETTTLNLGNITGGNLIATSLSGDIVDSGVLNNTGLLSYFSLPAGNLTLGNTSSSLGRVSIQGGGNHSIVSNSTLTLHTTTNTTGNVSLTTNNGAGVVLTGGNVGGLTVNSNGTVSVTEATTRVGGSLSLTAAGAVTDTAPGTLVVGGNATLSSATSLVLDGANDFSNVVINNSLNGATIADINDLTISGTSNGTLTATAGAALTGSVANPWSLVLGNLHVNGLVVASGNGGGGTSGTITQAAGTSIHSETLSSFTTRDANIIIGNNGNSFGRVELFTNPSASRTVTLVEDSTLKLGNVNSRGTTTLTSRFGSIIEDTVDAVVITNNGTLSANAVSGSILIGGTTRISNTTSGNLTAFTANAPVGAVAVSSTTGNANLALGNITANALTVTTGNITNGNGTITQTGRLNIFGTTNLTSINNITLSNTTNNFGRVFLTTTNATNGNIEIVEGGTLNLGGVTMAASATANFTATSVNGNIMDSGLSGLRPGGTIALPGTGSVSFSAASGNITLDDPTLDFPSTSGVSFTGGNVTIAVLGQAPLLLGATGVASTAGNLTATSSTGNIGNNGNLTVTGDALFQTGNGNITITQPDNRFGAVRFNAGGVAGAGQVRINQANDINIITGSSATGVAEFVSGSYITIANRGDIVSLGSTGNFTAAGSIVLPKLIQAVGTLTVFSPNLKDLSALSQAADLAGKAPVNLGTGTYVPPAP
jgi:hypothetical protein